MNFLEIINDIFQDNSLAEVSSKLNNLGDLLEYGDWSKKEIVESINCLLSQIKDIGDSVVIENILHICLNVMNSHNVFSGFELDSLVSCIRKLNSECISYVLTFIGFSGDKKYIITLNSFIESHVLKEEAEEALVELNYRIRKRVRD